MKRKGILLIFLLLASFQACLFSNDAIPSSASSSSVKIEEPGPITSPISLSEKQQDPYEHAFIKMILTLGGLLLLVFLTLWALRKISHGRVGNFGSQKKIKIIEKRPLSPKTVLYLLELDGKQVFISESQLEVRSILNLSESEL